MQKIRIGCVLLCILLCGGCAGSKGFQNANEKKSVKDSAETERLPAEGTPEAENPPDTEAGPHTVQNPQSATKLIVIDPGHSGVVAEGEEPVGPGASEFKSADTSGTVGVVTGVPEYELTMAVSQKLKLAFEAKGYQVLLTHETTDVPVSCTQRAGVANQAHADVFIRIHANGAEDSQTKGAMTICTTPDNPYASGLYGFSRALSDAVIAGLSQETGCENDGVWETDTMSGNNWSQVPVTIVEMGYMSNPEEDRLLADESYRNRIVTGIVAGVETFLGTEF